MSYNLTSPFELLQHIKQAAKLKRLSFNLSQKSLAEQSGVSLGSIKRFEYSGNISLESLLKIALVLDSLDEFLQLFPQKYLQSPHTLKDLFKDTSRKRGRK